MNVELSSYLMEEISHDVENLPFDKFLREIDSSSDTTSTAEESSCQFEFTDALEPTPIRSPDNKKDRRTYRDLIREELSEKNSHQFLDEYSQKVEDNAVMGKGNATTLVAKPYSDIVQHSSISNSNYHQGLESDKNVFDTSSQRQNSFPQQSESQNAKDLEAFSIAMEKLCQTMKRSAMSRTLVKQLSGRSLVKQSSGRNLTKQHSGRNLGALSKQSSGRNLMKQHSGRNLGALSRQASGRSLTCGSDSPGSFGGPVAPSNIPLRKSHVNPKHRINQLHPKTTCRGVLRQNSNKSLDVNQRTSFQLDDKSLGFLLANDNFDI